MLAALFACLLLAGPPTDSEITAAAEKAATAALEKPGAAGLSVAVAREGNIILSAGYGLAEVEHKVKADGDALFRIGSITKQFTAAAIMRLSEQGKLKLDDHICKYLSEYNAQGRLITVRHLLTHTSGIKSYTELRRVMIDEPAHEYKHEELVALFQDEPLEFDPGSQFKYCNSGYFLLGMIIEKVSGKTYSQYLQDEFFTPLHLDHTRCDSNSDIIPGRAQGYTLAGGKLVNDRTLSVGTPFAAGVIISSAHDLILWSEALASGKVVSMDSYKQMTTPFELPDGSSTGYGFGLTISEPRGHKLIAHNGGIFGFNSALMHFPDDHLTIAVISNSERIPSGQIAESIAKAALGEERP